MKIKGCPLFLFANCFLLAIWLVPSFPQDQEISGSGANYGELIRWSIISAERSLQSMDNELGEYIRHWKEINNILPKIANRDVSARAKLLVLKLISRSLSGWRKWNVRPEYTDWLQINGRTIYFGGDEDPELFVKSSEFWKLYEENKDLRIADDIVWEAVTNPEAQLCETDLPCYFTSLDNTSIKYLELFPDGIYAPLALDNILSFCLRFREPGFFRGRLEETYKLAQAAEGDLAQKDMEGIRSIISNLRDCILKMNASFPTLQLKKTAEIFELTLRPYLDRSVGSRGPKDAADIYEKIDHKKERDRHEIERVSYPLNHSFNLDLFELIDIWKKLDVYIKSNSLDSELVASAKLSQFICSKRIAGQTIGRRNAASQQDAWIRDHDNYLYDRKIRGELIWNMYSEFKDFPISDDIAWVAVNTISVTDMAAEGNSVYDFKFQFEGILDSIGRYLQLEPEGKYSHIALERILGFLRACLNMDPLTPPPFGLHQISQSDFRRICDGLVRILSSVKNKRAIEAIGMLDQLRISLDL